MDKETTTLISVGELIPMLTAIYAARTVVPDRYSFNQRGGMSEQLDRIEAVLGEVATQQAANAKAINQLTTNLETTRNELREGLSDLMEITTMNSQQADEDRRIFQSEIRRIWEYLLQQGRNGGTPQ